jgi:hypothetical protein
MAEAGCEEGWRLPGVVDSEQNCVAVGGYTANHSRGQALITTETHGIWRRGTQLTLPFGANKTTYEAANLFAVTSTGQDRYVAVGGYSTSLNNFPAMAVSSQPPRQP